jgi:UDP-N-acetylmuramyl pentapeptide phosphotransferase/UDP-N-acetylglucosamine-1-phosphate transferase
LSLRVDWLPGIFALVVAAAGWYYLFYSQAASKLQGVEQTAQNRLRVRLRRIGGLVILLLAASFYAMFVMLRRERFGAAGALLLLVMVLMGAVMVLGLIDLRFTHRMRGRLRPRGGTGEGAEPPHRKH